MKDIKLFWKKSHLDSNSSFITLKCVILGKLMKYSDP